MFWVITTADKHIIKKLSFNGQLNVYIRSKQVKTVINTSIT
jgi:hypothetical protein